MNRTEPSHPTQPDAAAAKHDVESYWDAQSCGEVYAVGEDVPARFAALRAARYGLEPYIPDFAEFSTGAGRDVLEIGVGMGCDHGRWAEAGPKSLAGIDLTGRAIDFTGTHLTALGLQSRLRTADAENLPFADDSFDIVYSWGVLHHSPDTPRAITEVLRVLRPGGTARVMIYHTRSLTGYMLWARYGLLAGRLFRPLRDIYAHHLESPGTKAYSVAEARELFAGFTDIDVQIQLNHGDLLQGEVGQRHRGLLLRIAKALWPRPLIRTLFRRHGLYLMIRAWK